MSRQPASPSSKASVPKRHAHAPDYLLLTTVLVIAVIGLIAVYSSSYALGVAQFDDANYFVQRQGVFLVLGIRQRFREQRDDTLGYWVRFGAATSLVAIGLQSLVEFSLQLPGNGVLFVVLLALAVHRPARPPAYAHRV